MMRMRMGFVGAGGFGAPMARRVREAGHAPTVCHSGAARARPFAARGGTSTAAKGIGIAADLAHAAGSHVPTTGLAASPVRLALVQGCTGGGPGSPMRFHSQGLLRARPANTEDLP